MANTFCWHELLSGDPGAAKEFYGRLFGWSFEDMPMGDMTYTMIKQGDDMLGGMMQNPCADAPPSWMVYVQVDDVEAAAGRAAELGGKVLQPKSPAGEFGHFAVVQDPTGAVFALWESVHKQ
jgi:predicted enzyme related to lactoylglutathione lyase